MRLAEAPLVKNILHGVITRIDSILSRREDVRDKLIKKSRDVIRFSSWLVNAILRQDLNEAFKLLNELENHVKEFMTLARKDERLFYSGLVDSTLAEYVEAKVLYGLVFEGRLYTPDELGVGEVPYLQGLGDVVGELRRIALDKLRVGDVDTAEKLLELMEVIYGELRILEYPEALIPGVKHKVDVARRLIDDTKALLIEVKGRALLLNLAGGEKREPKEH